MRNFKLTQRHGSILFEIVIAFVLMIVLLAPLIPSNRTIVQSVSDDILKDQALTIDNALNYWFSSHGGKYPDNLTVLQDMNFISPSVQLSLFSYTLQNNKTEYKLTVTLKNGSAYTSLGSKF